MLFTPEETKEQARGLWRECLALNDDFLNVYFEDKYSPDNLLTVRRDGDIVSALDLRPYRMTFYGTVTHVGYLSALATREAFRGAGYAANLLQEAHRRLYSQGAALSFLIPTDAEAQKYFERPDHGSYWPSVYRQELPLDVSQDGDTDKITVERPDEWPASLYVFYRRLTSSLPFMVHPTEEDFFAALSAADLGDAYVLTASRKRRMTGFCLAVKEPDGRVFIRTLAITEAAARAAFVQYLCRECGVEQVYRRFCLPGSLKGSKPYALARVIDVPRFLAAVAAPNPGFQLHVGVQGDLSIPENNGFYIVENGRVRLTDARPDSIVTPGGLAAMFMAAQPMVMDLLLDE